MNNCKYCLGPCVNDCNNKIIKRICPKCGVSYPKLYTFTRHLERKTSCLEDHIDPPKINTVNLEEIKIINKFSEEESKILTSNNILSKLMERYDEMQKKYILLENRYNYIITEKDKEIERLKKNSEVYYERKLKTIIEKTLEDEEIELLFNMLLEEKDNKIIEYTIQRFRDYSSSINKYMKSENMIKYNNEEKIELLKKLRTIISEDDFIDNLSIVTKNNMTKNVTKNDTKNDTKKEINKIENGHIEIENKSITLYF